jgi:hypothetical protein
MKNVTLFLASMALCSSAFSQECFIKAGFGAGSSASSFQVVSGDAYRNHIGLFSMQPQLGIGHRFGKLQVESGIGYWTSGVNFTSPDGVPHCGIGPDPHNPNSQTNTHEQPVNPINHPVRYSISNPHLVVPLVAGYYIGISKKLSVVPGVGIEGLYNFKGRMTTDISEAQSFANVHYDYNSFGAAVIVKADVQYQLGRNFGIWCSPSYQDMVSSLTTKVAGDGMSRTYDRAIMFNTGVRWTMHCSNTSSQEGK